MTGVTSGHHRLTANWKERYTISATLTLAGTLKRRFRMRSRRILKSVVCLTFVLLVSTAVWAQEYQIVRAEYGAGNLWVDVTHQLQEIAASNTTFRMGNSTFGVDPAPGVVKSLRILARNGRGRERTFQYREC